MIILFPTIKYRNINAINGMINFMSDRCPEEVEDVDAFEDPDDVDREEVGVKDARHRA